MAQKGESHEGVAGRRLVARDAPRSLRAKPTGRGSETFILNAETPVRAAAPLRDQRAYEMREYAHDDFPPPGGSYHVGP